MTATISLGTPESPIRFRNYGSIISNPMIRWLGQLSFPYSPSDLEGVDAVIISDEWGIECRTCIAACKIRNIPVFHILDGVIRWKNLFENPRSLAAENGSPFLRPLISDMTFVMGDLQYSILKWLGNSKICVSGLPRFAHYHPKSCRYGDSPRPHVLLATSNSPWYTESQREFFIPCFQRVIDTLRQDCETLGIPYHCRLSPFVKWQNIEPSWLGPHPPLYEQLKNCTVLITTPSTIAIEAMLVGIPTLIFDPWADPCLVPSCWTADHAEVVSNLLPSLLSPTKERASMQDLICKYTVRDCRDSAELIVNAIAREVASRRAPIKESPSSDSSPINHAQAPHIECQRDWDLDTPHVIGLVQTIPQLAALLYEERITMHAIRGLSDKIQATNTPLLRVIAQKVKKRLFNSKFKR